MTRLLACCLFASLAGLVSCGETTFTLFDDRPEGPPLSVTYLIEGGAADQLLSLAVTIDEVRLLRAEEAAQGGQGTGALLEPATIEMLGLEDRARLLTTRYYGDGVYTHVRVDFGRDPVAGRWHDGEAVSWASASPRSILVALPEPWDVTARETLAHTLLLSLDPAESISGLDGATSNGPLGFVPVLRARALLPGERVRADDFWGGLVSATTDHTVLFFAAEMERTVADRRVPAAVALDQATILLDPGGQPAAGLAGLSIGSELVNARFLVQGDYTAGGPGYQAQMRASSIQLDSLVPANGSDSAIVAEARIVERQPSGLFRVRLVELERGEALARDSLMGLDALSSLDVVVGTFAQVQHPWQELGSRQDLHVGMRVKIHLDSFLDDPLRASRVLIQESAEHRGTLLGSEPGQNLMRLVLDPDAAAIEGGLVAGESTPVAVTPGSLFARIDVVGEPLVLLAQAPAGLRAVVRGRLTGTPHSPEISGGEVILRPGRFVGRITSWALGEGAFDASVESIEAPFGGETEAPPFRVRIMEECAFEGEGASLEEFRGLFSELAPGEAVTVGVSGIAGENPNEVLAYQIQSQVQ